MTRRGFDDGMVVVSPSTRYAAEQVQGAYCRSAVVQASINDSDGDSARN